ncbi:MAG: pyrroloquinoline quinone-dependent dehydrogenase [Bacteroidetes bacterium]|nr:pyrroloquinoline quinone-dependent dehydrogenase [Bacteroidota bacterium]MDA1120808.1 pyrroloquinoline quinone-dependent dehydrogenase [Bacteroidota bacterium]
MQNRLLISIFLLADCSQAPDGSTIRLEAGKDYPTYGGNNANNRYSPLTQINTENVNNLEVAWTYFANDTLTQGSAIQCQPIVVDGILYGTSAELNLFALEAGTGKQLWKFVPPDGGGRIRGVMYWEGDNDKRILYTAGSYLYAVDAITGKSIVTFGNNGRTDLHDGLSDNMNHDVSKLRVGASSPGVIYKNTLVIGSSVSESGDAAPGHIRAFDVITGKLKWVFHTIPQPGEFGYDTWPDGAYLNIGAANSWGGMSLDEKRGVVYFGTGSPASDFYGGAREGMNLFSNCIMALDAATGEMKWYFQGIHHDLWDRDFPIPPNLTTVTRDGKKIDVVVQAGKDGVVYVLNRDTGESIFPFQEKPVPTEGLPGEHPYPTQKYMSKPKPLSEQLITEDNITDISPEAHEFVLQRLKEFPIMESRFQPPSAEGTVLFGYSGGAEWGGNAIDPEGILYQNVNNEPWELKMIRKEMLDEQTANLSRGNALYMRNCSVCHGENRKGISTLIPSLVNVKDKYTFSDIEGFITAGNGRMPAFGYLSAGNRKAIIEFLLEIKVVEERGNNVAETVEVDDQNEKSFPYMPEYISEIWTPFTDHNGYPAVKPPWGTLNAIDLSSGDYLWTVPLGEYPELTAKGIPVTGTESYGGPVVTASGLIFIAGTRDERIRAFDKNAGDVLWEYQLPAGGFATPITYEVDGVQYVAIAAGGGRGAKPGGWYMAFALK